MEDLEDDPLKIEGAEGSSITGSTSTAVRPSRSAVEERRGMGLDWKSGVFLVLVYSKTARRHVMTPSEVASAHWPLAIGALRNPSWSLVPSYHRGLYTHALSSPGRTKSSVPLSDPPPCAPANGRPGGFPFGFLGAGGRRLPKARRGRVFIAQYYYYY